ncbi:MAG: MMPL family transporter, partial [Solirubrobacteraceae bacterium]
MRRIAQWCHDRHRLVIATWVALIVAVGGLAAASGGGFVDNFSLPGSESQKAVDLLQSKFPQQAGDASQVVFKANTGTLNDTANKTEIQDLVTTLSALPSVAGVQDPYGAPGQISKDGTIAFATVAFDKQASDLDKTDIERVIGAAKAAATDDLQVNLGGYAIKVAEQPAQSATEAIGVLVAIAVLIIVLGSVAAMTMPLIVTFASLGLAMTIVLAASSIFDIASFAPTLAVMIALGVGIDYALLILNRFRGERRRGADIRDAT